MIDHLDRSYNRTFPDFPLSLFPSLHFCIFPFVFRSTSSSSWEINFTDIQLYEEVGRGAYGAVWKGKWRGIDVSTSEFPSLYRSCLHL